MTVAVDTNIVVRILVDDDARQVAMAKAVLSRDFALLPSVLLETEWVLRSSYKWPRARIGEALATLIDLPTLREAPPGIGWVIERFASGADLADMLHLAAAGAAEGFVTFDRRLAKAAGQDTPVPIEMLP
ncbi:MAG: type II toxin-antitoxin system VapC family toxin [Pseudomonadota bacterium]